MTAARLTPAEARALGVDVPARQARTTRRTARREYLTRCHDCGETFPSVAAEDRHLADTGHHRYDLDLTT